MTGAGPGSSADSATLKALFPHVAVSDDVTVRVSVSFLPEQSDPARGRWFWAYHIRIENHGAEAVQLLSRHWIISDAHGARHDVQGDGVVGEQPMIAPGAAYDYVSGCPLETRSGEIQGSYRMVSEDGSFFDVRIPVFPLSAPPVISR